MEKDKPAIEIWEAYISKGCQYPVGGNFPMTELSIKWSLYA